MSTTVDQVIGLIEAGKKPESLWLKADRSLELKFEDGDVIPLPETAIGDEFFGSQDSHTHALAKIVIACKWEKNLKEALRKIRLCTMPEGRVYPPLF